jgi:alkane 1-monooxygenase
MFYARFLALPILVCTGFYLGGWWCFITPAICFFIHPILNLIPFNSAQIVREEAETVFRTVEFIYVPVLLLLTFYITARSASLSNYEFTGMAISVGMVNGILGFTIAHEFIHRHNHQLQVAGYILLMNNLYMHYGIEHIRGHHVYASTPKDPHTARLGESFYSFLPRTMFCTFINAVHIQKKLLKRSNQKWYSVSNRLLLFMLQQIVLLAAIAAVAGVYAVLFFILQAFVAVVLLHAVNYLQHYGLMRKETNGSVERMADHHAWNSGNRLKNLSLFRIENHAHHHIHPTHPYETLQHTDSPTHPTGYSGMILLALVPTLWFRIVHKRLFIHLKTVTDDHQNIKTASVALGE